MDRSDLLTYIKELEEYVMTDQKLPTVTVHFREDGGFNQVEKVKEIDVRTHPPMFVVSHEEGVSIFPYNAVQQLHVDGEVSMKEKRG